MNFITMKSDRYAIKRLYFERYLTHLFGQIDIRN